MSERQRPVLAIYSSGTGGSTFRAFAEAAHDGIVNVDIPLVISNTENAGAFDHAAILNSTMGFDIRCSTINQHLFPKGPKGRRQTDEESEAMLQMCYRYGVTHLGLMGGLRILGEPVIEAYGWLPKYAEHDTVTRGIYLAHALNTHPAILPLTADTYGIGAQRKLKDVGAEESGHTIHVVSENPDEGPIVAEHRFKIFAEDTPEMIFARVQRIEKAMLPIVWEQFLKEQADFLANPLPRISE